MNSGLCALTSMMFPLFSMPLEWFCSVINVGKEHLSEAYWNFSSTHRIYSLFWKEGKFLLSSNLSFSLIFFNWSLLWSYLIPWSAIAFLLCLQFQPRFCCPITAEFWLVFCHMVNLIGWVTLKCTILPQGTWNTYILYSMALIKGTEILDQWNLESKW